MAKVRGMATTRSIVGLLLATAPGCSDSVEKTKEAGFAGNDAGRCPISGCKVSTNGEACCDCCWIASPAESHACNIAKSTCYTFCSSCLPEGYQFCDGAEGSLLGLCRSKFSDGGP